MPDSSHPATPFEAVFRQVAEERFPALREALAADAIEGADRDAFLLHRAVVELVRELRPEQGFGDAMPEFVALLHHAYLFWRGGERLFQLDRGDVARLLATPAASADAPAATEVCYARYPGRLIWAAPTETGRHEPLDGCFLGRAGDRLALTAVFGFHPDRAGFTVVATQAPRAGPLARADGTELFSPVLDGAREAGLYALVGMEELLELGWRTEVEVRVGAVATRGAC